MQEDVNTPTENQVNGENEQSMSQTQDEQRADAGQRPALYGRKVLSFVRRSARLDARLQRAWDAYADTYLLKINAGEGSLDVRGDLVFDRAYIADVWGNVNPLIVEIGTGQGENVVAAAAEHPDMNFLALEVYDPGVAHTMLLAGKQGLTNLRIAQVNAPELFKAAADGSIAEVWTFFPDRGPRCATTSVVSCSRSLPARFIARWREWGVWRIATDIEDYALHVHEVMDGLEGFHNDGMLTVSLPVEHVGKGNADEAAGLRHADFTESERFSGRILTNFEKKRTCCGSCDS